MTTTHPVADALNSLTKAVTDLTEAANADPAPAATNEPTEWPAGVTARILTRGSILTHDRNATVDIHDNTDRSTARCRPCGWTKNHGIAYRGKVLDWAQEHADQCTGLAQPNT